MREIHRVTLPNRRNNQIGALAYVLYKQNRVIGVYEDLVSDLVREIDCLRYERFWAAKGIAVIEQQAFLSVAKRWLSLPKPNRISNVPSGIFSAPFRPAPIHSQIREGFEMMNGEILDVSLEDSKDPSVWISQMDSGQKDLIRENY